VITLVQRVSRAEVRVGDEVVGRIGAGLLLLVGVERGDQEREADASARKVAALRIFVGKHPLDRSVKDVGGACLVVSQFTLVGSLRKGNRPGFEGAEQPERARALYERVAERLAAEGLTVAMGRFGAHMEVESVNDGPVTFVVVVRDGVVQPISETPENVEG
jgi:D-tyrosyl-tRNA(Tyr) deacylase